MFKYALTSAIFFIGISFFFMVHAEENPEPPFFAEISRLIQELKNSITNLENKVTMLQEQSFMLYGNTVLDSFAGAQNIFPYSLSRGMRDSSVKLLQTCLARLKFFNYPDFTDYYGEVTEKAVMNFQHMRGIADYGDITHGSGRVGPTTRAILNVACIPGAYKK